MMISMLSTYEHATQHGLEYDIIVISTSLYQKYHQLKLFIILCSNIRTSSTHKQPKWSFFHPNIKRMRGLVLEELLVNNPYFRKMPSVWLDLPRKLQINEGTGRIDRELQINRLSLRNKLVEVQDSKKRTDQFGGICRIYLKSTKKNRKDHTIHVTGCTWKHWDFDQFCPTIYPGHRCRIPYRRRRIGLN